MLLLRTRAEIVEAHIDAVIEEFPTPQALAGAEIAAVEDALRPFGLRWRARRIHETAQLLADSYNGDVPKDLKSLLDLPGVGPYVASATLAALTGSRVVLTDTNTVRVATRVAGITPRGDVRRRKDVQASISTLMGGRTTAGDWLAVIDLAARICLPRDPRCAECPIDGLCSYGLATVNPSEPHQRHRVRQRPAPRESP